ncbi:fimbrial protein [Chania multitudinisentens RB-25]|uniref:Fimbrial protein n=1 Tax=Chania multitudinisentens RB-25 TaxID=1441930 RepID=W0L9K4_9GAMM|nr:fimbrial protein [Chania multitudinisentens]AHG18695.1 fimbrial protein [Chania multitudinisentens RB-25]
MNSLRLFLIAGALFSWMAASQVSASSGVIRFVGAIVEGPCLVNVVNSTANTQCYRNGRNYTGTQALTRFNAARKELPLNLGTSEMRWVDRQQKLAIMTVVYR